jgi:predicted O-methyltransferase YrrM
MEGQLNQQERTIITGWVTELKPERTLEVGTWLGGGSTLHILKALEENSKGHLWGIEASPEIYEGMVANIRSAGEELVARFTPVFGFSQKVIPNMLKEMGNEAVFGFVFLDGGDNPMEQIEEFQLIRDRVPVGGVVMGHDAHRRKGKWLVPYLRAHDNWECVLHDVSEEGLFEARKVREQPSEDSRRKTEAVLSSLRRQPAELLGRWLPSPVINLILRCLPRNLLLKITQGRKRPDQNH